MMFRLPHASNRQNHRISRYRSPVHEASLPAAPNPSAGAPDEARDGGGLVETYGCQMNVADTEMVLGPAARRGLRAHRGSGAPTDVILLNTCAVREKAEERVFARASMLAEHKARPGVVLGITGCMAEHLKGAIRERAPYVDLVIGPDGYRRLVEHVEAARAGRGVDDTRLDRAETYEGLDPAREMTGGVTGHVTIQRGCDKFCTFCVVPYTRGRERGTPPREVLRQARAMAAAGYKEVQLLGQTVNSYRYEDVGFAELLRAVATVDGIERIRFTSPYPLDFSDDVIAAMAETPKVCKHVHLPLQTASDAVLARMKRGYDFAAFRGLVGAARGHARHRDHDRPPGRLLRRDRGRVRAEILRAQEELRFDSRLHVRLLRARGHDGRAQDARHRPRGGQVAPPRRGDRAAATDHGRDPGRAGRPPRARARRPRLEALGLRVPGAHRRVPPRHRPRRARRGAGRLLDVTIARATRAMLFAPVPA